MPTLQSFGNFEIRVYFTDHNPPHVQGVSRDGAALVRISDGAVMRGEIGAAMLAKAQAWVAERKVDLLARCAEYQK